MVVVCVSNVIAPPKPLTHMGMLMQRHWVKQCQRLVLYALTRPFTPWFTVTLRLLFLD